MFNALKYIKTLEEVGIPRKQAEAQIQVLMDAVEGELVTKTDLNNLRQEIAHTFTQAEYRIVTKLALIVGSMMTISVAIISWIIKH